MTRDLCPGPNLESKPWSWGIFSNPNSSTDLNPQTKLLKILMQRLIHDINYYYKRYEKIICRLAVIVVYRFVFFCK